MEKTTAIINYLSSSESKPRVFMHDDPAKIRRPRYHGEKLSILDGRHSKVDFTLDHHGFIFTSHNLSLSMPMNETSLSVADELSVKDFVRLHTDANQIEVIDHTIRSSDASLSHRGAAIHAHNDYTENSIRERLVQHIGSKAANQWFKNRVMQVNLWKPLRGPVRVAPLAILDASTVSKNDLVTCDIIYPDRVGDIYEIKYNPNHQWYYFPKMTVDEAILFKGYDSIDDGRARFTPHSAFHHPESKASDPPRQSIEVRCIVNF